MAISENENNYITVKGLHKYFSQRDSEQMHILDDINFSVKKGEVICIVGSSGCGKSTLLRAICGLDAEHEGTVLIDGIEITKPDKHRGMVFQEHRLFPWLTVEQNVGYALNNVSREDKKGKSSIISTL